MLQQALSAYSCSLSGSLPATVSQLSALTYLYMNYNAFAPPTPLSLFQHNTGLQTLSLYQAGGVTGTLDGLSSLVSLRYLNLNSAGVSGTLDALTQMTALSYL